MHGTPTRVLITVDVEDPYYPVQMRRIWGGTEAEGCGIPRIMDILEEYGFPGVFFVDVYESALHSLERMDRVMKSISDRGHEVQLHTHPGVNVARFGRGGMSGRPLQQQYEIIQSGADAIRRSVGRSPLAHRAGGYKADRQTIQAVAMAGIEFDSSLFYKNPNCRIDGSSSMYNDILPMQGILEVPITTVRVDLPIVSPLMKLDIEQDESVLRKGMFAMRQAGARTIVIFLHSWSFVELYAPRSVPRADRARNLHRICQLIQSRSDEFQVCGFERLSHGEAIEECAVAMFPRVRLSPMEATKVIAGKMKNRAELAMNAGRIRSIEESFGF